MADISDVIIRPIVTEKSTALSSENKYCFEVAKNATKTRIRQAVERLFGVDVQKVNTIRYTGKVKRMGVHQGKQPDWKKAIVTLKEGQTIEIFEGL